MCVCLKTMLVEHYFSVLRVIVHGDSLTALCEFSELGDSAHRPPLYSPEIQRL